MYVCVCTCYIHCIYLTVHIIYLSVHGSSWFIPRTWIIIAWYKYCLCYMPLLSRLYCPCHRDVLCYSTGIGHSVHRRFRQQQTILEWLGHGVRSESRSDGYFVPMYNICTCIYTLWTITWNVCTCHYMVNTMYIHGMYMVVCQLRRLMTGRRLLWRSGAWAELRLAGVARLIWPDGKWSVVVKLYRLVCTMYIQIY